MRRAGLVTTAVAAIALGMLLIAPGFLASTGYTFGTTIRGVSPEWTKPVLWAASVVGSLLIVSALVIFSRLPKLT